MNDFAEFWRRVEQEREDARRRGGDLVPRKHAHEIMQSAIERGVHFLITEVDGSDQAIITVMDKHDGLPVPEHGGPPRIIRR
jgi:hypothetical protein